MVGIEIVFFLLAKISRLGPSRFVNDDEMYPDRRYVFCINFCS